MKEALARYAQAKEKPFFHYPSLVYFYQTLRQIFLPSIVTSVWLLIFGSIHWGFPLALTLLAVWSFILNIINMLREFGWDVAFKWRWNEFYTILTDSYFRQEFLKDIWTILKIDWMLFPRALFVIVTTSWVWYFTQ